jgi:hypothetical protein
MSRVALICTAVLLLSAAPALAQDPATVDPDHYQVVFENDDVRVLRITYGADEESVMHEHPVAVFVALTANKVKMTFPDGSTEEVIVEESGAIWTPAGKHVPKNVGDEAMEGILVELKNAGGD